MSSNILTTLHVNLEEFKQRKLAIERKVNEQKFEKEQTSKSILALQEKNISLISQIESSNSEIETLELNITEIQTGYDNLLETGEFLMQLVNTNKK
jgi:chromosome segregation ATPase